LVIVVTGGAGFIGSHLVELLANGDEPLRVLERPGASVEHLPGRAEIVRCDIRDRNHVRDALRGCKTVYHLAGNPNLWTRDRRDFDAINHHGTANVLREALDAGAERVLHSSTESILTSRRFQGGAVEDLELRAEDMVGPYCLSKFRGEQVALDLARAGEPVVIASPTLPVGPGDRGMSPPTRMTVACCRGKLPAYLECQLNMIDVRDVATGMAAALRVGRPGRRYLLGGKNMLLSDWLRMISERVGRKAPRWRAPYVLALGVAHVSEFIADLVTGRMPNATVTGVKLTRYCMHFDPAPSLKELGVSPRPLENSLDDAIRWYRDQGWI
jgi:dihydroflavonol-4-reductase